MRSAGPAVIVVVVLLAGCAADKPASPTPSPGTTSPTPTTAGTQPPAVDENGTRLLMQGCSAFQGVPCFEPWIWADGSGRIFVVTGKGDRFVASNDSGKQWTDRPAPPLAPRAPAGGQGGDTVVQTDSKGRLYWHALFYDPQRTQGQFGSGILVARSDDGGASWALSTYLDQATHPQMGTGFTDRQWMATGAGDTVYLAFWEVGVGSWVSTSTDAGRSFGPFLRAVTVPERQHALPHGPLAYTPKGTLLLPYHALINPTGGGALLRGSEVRVARSTDGGQIFSQVLVASGSQYGASGYWPDVAVEDSGRITVAWTSDSGAMWVSHSQDDGLTWSAPVRWNPAGDAPVTAPRLVVQNATAHLSWYSARDQGSARVVLAARGPVGATSNSQVQVWEASPKIVSNARLTDLGAVAALVDGSTGAVWVDPKAGVSLHVRAP